MYYLGSLEGVAPKRTLWQKKGGGVQAQAVLAKTEGIPLMERIHSPSFEKFPAREFPLPFPSNKELIRGGLRKGT